MAAGFEEVTDLSQEPPGHRITVGSSGLRRMAVQHLE